MTTDFEHLQFFDRLNRHPGENIALRTDSSSLSYAQLRVQFHAFAASLLAPGENSLKGERTALVLPAGIDYTVALLGTWYAGGVAVPLNVNTPANEIKHALTTARVSRLFSDEKHLEISATVCSELGIPFALCETGDTSQPNKGASPTSNLRKPNADTRALLLFTSGTTNKPKGVVTTHKNLSAQVDTLLEAWQWRADDVIPLFLPMHHVHGIINVLCCALGAGAQVNVFQHFDMPGIFEAVARKDYTLFMAVPTIYVKMIKALQDMKETGKGTDICEGFAKLRLMISGSAACPVSVHRSWENLTGQMLLERYGMTEIGMALSNPYAGIRKAGTVGQALPGVELVLVDEQSQPVKGEDVSGEIWIKGPNVFLEYWENPEATQATFSEDGWFKTGDIAILEAGYYRIMGRSSVDIIKTGGEKVSALEIESTLLEHEDIAECAVIGVPDETWGEAIVAAIVLNEGCRVLQKEELKAWCKSCMSGYKVPKRFEIMDALPRNAMGKITKPALGKLLK